MFVCDVTCSETVTLHEAVDELRRSVGPISIIVDVPRQEFNVVNLLLSNDLLQACQCYFHCLFSLTGYFQLQDSRASRNDGGYFRLFSRPQKLPDNGSEHLQKFVIMSL